MTGPIRESLVHDAIDARPVPAGLWISMALRAIPAATVAAVITFTQERSVDFGFFTFGAFALVFGVMLAVEAFRMRGFAGRSLVLTRGLVTAITGAVSLAFGAMAGVESVAVLIWLIAGWAAVSGAVELVTAIRLRPARVLARESMLGGAISLVLAVFVALVPPELHDEYGGLENVQGALTAPVQVDGAVGAYTAILAVLLVIEALTLRAEIRRGATERTIDNRVDSSTPGKEV